MTGRDLIIYILENHLENEELFKDGTFPGLLTYDEAAKKFNVGVHTIRTWVELGMLEQVSIKAGVGTMEILFIPATAELNIKGGNDE